MKAKVKSGKGGKEGRVKLRNAKRFFMARRRRRSNSSLARKAQAHLFVARAAKRFAFSFIELFN